MNKMITIKHLNVSFNQTEVFRDFSLELELGKITAIFGPNGAGKSTLLNSIAGVSLSGVTVKSLIPKSNNFELSYIFQDYRKSLLPWRTNLDNLVLPLEIQKKSRQEQRQRVSELLKLFDPKINWQGYPYELSCGQQQLLAFLRAFISQPKIILIDEPFASLDYENSLRLREFIQNFYLAFKPTILLVTHNIEEAVHLSERIIILSQKPSMVMEEFNNKSAYPRKTDFLKTDFFRSTVNQALAAFKRSVSL